MCIILTENLYHTLKCKYSDCIIAILTLPYLTLFLVTLYYFMLVLYIILCYAILTCSISCWVMTPCCMDQLNKINKLKTKLNIHGEAHELAANVDVCS